MKQWLQAFIAAIQFLTRIPVPVNVPFTNEVLKRSTLFYPWAGCIVGVLIWGAGLGLQLVLPAGPAAVLTLALAVALTGGLHMDGLMDTADGVLSHRSRERMLEIMKDSRVGAMGVIACILVLLLKWSLIASLMTAGAWQLWLVVPFIWSRAAMVWGMTNEPYARAESGLGSYFQGLHRGHLLGAVFSALMLSLATVYIMVSVPLEMAGWSASFAALAAYAIHPWWLLLGAPVLGMGAVWGCSRYLSKKLGGLTGDTYGAMNELTETILLLLLVLMTGWRG
ncbi:adenosylcobinamide-GDP ribazoletransferase [Paenibacillus profundus]|uniref:Adenosylcobinamide-GDP ribazoletransferase n=1 Tax=Paenibacillus profundus TaxID=1173085 RepID=A0ABS8YEK1_9BACL|nr:MULTISPECIES: adenosylcobinamide-GDP ribazoletransferase [Paenibacillus]MCE5168765.1 adenosylcobinamide-GDP ribazoletransferase [Paenibacillus profundus]MCM3338430.1 adenosylcobinamide-GDP ribazoletransferase [Paenibacillus sp. MER TA 81-3]